MIFFLLLKCVYDDKGKDSGFISFHNFICLAEFLKFLPKVLVHYISLH